VSGPQTRKVAGKTPHFSFGSPRQPFGDRALPWITGRGRPRLWRREQREPDGSALDRRHGHERRRRTRETLSGLTEDTLYRWRARVLYAPYSVTQVGIKPPPNPAHGPWRRVSAQANEADIRVVPEPGAIVSLASGLALLNLLHRRRKAAA
jgi:hypothetical protein